MCGIVGFIDYSCKLNKSNISDMTLSLKHRGPDYQNHKIFNKNNYVIGLGHSRLSIIDVSNAGNQPMTFRNFHITYNGEVYNYLEIKKDLINKGFTFESDSDTEVVLKAFVYWGHSFVNKLIGMFAIVIYDDNSNQIHFFRDRAGVKPLYYYIDDKYVLFSSELKAFNKLPGFQNNVDDNSIFEFINVGFISAPRCIYKNTFKLESGSYLKFNILNKEKEIIKYWSVDQFYKMPKHELDYNTCKTNLKTILKSAFNYRMVSDVPVGVFLSGGYDSSCVAALLREKHDKLKTFTIGFDSGNNEAPQAKKIASILGTDHNQFYCRISDAVSIIENLPYIYDEPFGDSSSIPTILVSQFASKHVKVVLSADGADEIFSGYNYYDNFNSNINFYNNVKLLRQILPIQSLNKLILKSNLFKDSFSKKIDVFTKMSSNSNLFPFKTLHNNYFKLGQKTISKLFINNSFDSDFFKNQYLNNPFDYAMSSDYKFYLQDDIMTKVDRASMSVSIESREPFLDHRIIEYASRIPLKYKYNSGQKKIILKDIVHDYIPKSIMSAPKRGFTVPLEKWMRNELLELICDSLSSSNFNKLGIFNTKYINVVKDNLNNNRDVDVDLVWKLFQLSSWSNKWLNND